mgnify:CR=1 FL=1
MSGSHIIVTGASGLLGNAVRLVLEERGCKVLAVDRSAGQVDGRPVLAADVTDVHALHGLAHEHDIGGIIHCGAFSGPMVAADSPVQMVDVNIVGTANMLELARRVGGVRFVFCSSASAVGPTPEGLSPVTEAVATNPSTVYGASKVAGEALVSGYRRQFGVDGVSIRISWVYGPRRTTSCVIRQMITDALAGRPTRLPYGKGFPRQFIHVSDAAVALVAAFDHPDLPLNTYNVTGGDFTTLDDVAEAVRGIEPRSDIALDEGTDPGDDFQQRFDISAAARDFGYRPGVSLAEGITAYRDWLAAQAGKDSE